MPRKATHGTMKLLENGRRLITIEGGPLVGKSNVLREIAERSAQHDGFVFSTPGACPMLLRTLSDHV